MREPAAAWNVRRTREDADCSGQVGPEGLGGGLALDRRREPLSETGKEEGLLSARWMAESQRAASPDECVSGSGNAWRCEIPEKLGGGGYASRWAAGKLTPMLLCFTH